MNELKEILLIDQEWMIILKHKFQQKGQVETSVHLNMIKVVSFLCEARALREHQIQYLQTCYFYSGDWGDQRV